MKKKQESVMDMFNLPSFTKGKTFAEASKAIAKQFEGRSDKESVETQKELQGRLQQAQEYIKAKSQPQSQSQGPQHQMPDGSMMPGAQHSEPQAQQPMAMGGKLGQESNDYFLGGITSMLGGDGGAGAAGGAEAAGAAAGGGPGPGGYLQAATGAMELGKMAFGKPNVDTSGAVDPGKGTSKGGAALGGAMKGSQAGMAFGPWGAAVGGVLGGAAGLIGGGKAQKAETEAEIQNTALLNKGNNNRYDLGGFMKNTDPNELIKMLGQNQMHEGGALGHTHPEEISPFQQSVLDSESFYAAKDKKAAAAHSASNDYFAGEADKKAAFDADPNAAAFKKMGLDDESLDMQEMEDQTLENEGIGSWLKTQKTTTTDDKEEGSKYDPSTLLRYAPAVTDAYQLAALEKPEEVSRDKLGNKYQSQQVDEKTLQRTVQEGINNQRDAILSSSGGSQSAARANLLGLSLQGTKAMSAAMAQASEQNRADNRVAQNFNLNVDQTNLQQSNAEKLANEQNQGAYDTQKSQLISQLGSNLGEVGKEQLFKKYPELMGLDFNSMGKYLKRNKKGTVV